MTREEKSVQRAKEICEADGEALSKYCEDNWNSDTIIELVQEKQ